MINTIEHPYSSSKQHGAGGDWYPNISNFPACKLLLHADDYTSGNIWTARISGAIFTSSTGYLKDSDGVIPNTSALFSLSGALPAMGTKQFVLFAVGKFHNASATISLGDTATTGPGIALNGGATEYIMRDAANYLNSNVLTSTAPSYPATGCMTLHADTSASNDARKTYAGNDGTVFASSLKNGAGSLGTIAGTWPALSNVFTMPTASGTSRIKILALFAFTNAPSAAEIVIATRWHAMNLGKLYPRFAGVS